MKKLLLIFFGLVLIMPISALNSNAKVVKRNWCSDLKVSKFGIYSLGCHLSDYKPYYLLRGKNWVYSGDTFGFEAGNEMKNSSTQYNIRMQISVIKGSATKLNAKYFIAGEGTYPYTSLSFRSTIYGVCNFWSVWEGRIYVKSKKGCTVQIKFSQKYTTSNSWNSYTIKVKVKKRP